MNDNHHRWNGADWFAVGIFLAAIVAMILQLWVV